MEDTTTTTAPAGPITTYSQDQAAARLAEIGQSIGGQLRYVPQRKIRRVPNPAADPNNPNYVFGSPPTIDTEYTVETWYDPRTNTPIFAGERQADGSFNVTLDATPRQSAARTGPPGGKPYIDEEGPNGHRLGWNPETQQYDIDRGLSAAAQQPPSPQEQVAQQNAQTAQELNNERSYNLNHGGLYETHAERRAREQKEAQENAPKTSSQAVQRNGQTYIVATTTDKNGNIVKSQVLDTSGQPVQGGLPAEQTKPQPVSDGKGGWGYWDTSKTPPVWVALTGGPGGKKYSDVKFDEDAGVWWGLTPDGQWERMQGGPGTTPSGRGAGPSAPQIILGHSTEGLRQYGDTLNQAVADGTLTPAQATQRWNQAVQTAQVAYNEATILQREQESNLNASVSLANTRMSAANSGFNTALQVVANLNDKLPVGSNLGGQAFAAILGLQMAHAQRMGAYDNIRPGSQPSIRDIMSQPYAPPPPGPAPAPAAPPPAQAPDTAPPPPVASPAVDQAPASPPLITQPSLITSPPPEPPAGEPESTLPNFTDPTTGRFGIPGSFATGPYTAPEPQGAASPTSDYPVLAGLAPPPPPPPTPTAFTPEPTYGSLPPALLYTQAAATPFWRMSPEEVAAYQAAGIPDDVIRSGTMVTA